MGGRAGRGLGWAVRRSWPSLGGGHRPLGTPRVPGRASRGRRPPDRRLAHLLPRGRGTVAVVTFEAGGSFDANRRCGLDVDVVSPRGVLPQRRVETLAMIDTGSAAS